MDVGVVLSVLDFRERDQIVTIFSPEGLVKVFVRGKQGPLMSVLTEGEFVFEKGRGDLLRFQDGSVLNQHLGLRERFESLEAAGAMVQAVLKSQWQGKEAPGLYHLFCLFLRAIPKVEQPKILHTIFLVKILKHEGFFQQLSRCSCCDNMPNVRFGGERFCQKHAPVGALYLSEDEENWLIQMAQERSLSKLLEKPFELHNQVATLFDQAFL